MPWELLHNSNQQFISKGHERKDASNKKGMKRDYIPEMKRNKSTNIHEQAKRKMTTKPTRWVMSWHKCVGETGKAQKAVQRTMTDDIH